VDYLLVSSRGRLKVEGHLLDHSTGMSCLQNQIQHEKLLGELMYSPFFWRRPQLAEFYAAGEFMTPCLIERACRNLCPKTIKDIAI